jgi:hypothetical protein
MMRRNILPVLVLLALAAIAHANDDGVNWFTGRRCLRFGF